MINKNRKLYKAHKKIKEAISAKKKTLLWKLKGCPAPPPHIVKEKIIKHYASKFGVKLFIETGTYMGEMIDALLNVFSKIVSIELDAQLANRAKLRYRDYPHVTILEGDSGKVLPEILPAIKEPCLFWLDAHYSGEGTAKGDLETPILRELACIMNHPYQNHVVLIDDASAFGTNSHYPSLDAFQRLILSLPLMTAKLLKILTSAKTS